MHRRFFSVTILYFLSGMIWLLIGTFVIGMIDSNVPATDLSVLYHYKNGIFIFISSIGLFFLLKGYRNHLLKVEDNYHKLFEGSPGAAYVIDKKTFRFLIVNDVMVNKYGYGREELLNMTAMDIRSQGEQKRLNDYLFSDHEEGHETGVWQHIKKNGDSFYVLISHHSVKFQEQDAYMVIAIDIDQGMRNEKKLKEIRWQNSHELRKPAGNIKGLIELIKENEITDPQVIKMLTSSVDELDGIIQKINLNN